MSFQNWNDIVVTNKQVTKQANEQKKKAAPKPKVSKNQKVEEEQKDFHHASVGRDFTVALQRARMAKKWSQKDLAQRLNVKQSVINEYESGKVIPDSALIAKMNRMLGCKLPPVQKPKSK